MQTQIETISSLERRLTLSLPSDSIEKEVSDRLKQLTRTVKMHGFRPGKVPLKLVQQQYGPQVHSEVIGNAVQKGFDQAVQENKLRVAGYPRIEPKDEADKSQIAFAATFEIYPEIKLGDVSGSKIERLALTVADADVDKTIEILRKQRVTWVAAERAAAEGDRVTVDFTGKLDGVEFAGGKGQMPIVLGEGRMLPDFEKGISGMKTGESRTFDVKFPDDYSAENLKGKTAQFDATATAVEAPVLPAIDAELAKSLGVADGDTDKMRTEVRGNVEREVAKRIEADLKSKVMQALVDSTPIELPKSLVDMEIERMVQSMRADFEARGMKMDQLPINPQMFEEQGRRRVSLGLIIGELVKVKELKPKPDLVKKQIEDYAQSYEHPAEVVKWIYSDPQRYSEFEALALEASVVKWVIDNAKVEDKPIGFDELMAKAG